MVVGEFVCFGYTVHSTTQSSADISRCNASTRAAMQNLDIRSGSQESPISTKLQLYNTFILPIFLYGSESGQLPKVVYSKLMILINGVCESCWELSGAAMCGTIRYDRRV